MQSLTVFDVAVHTYGKPDYRTLVPTLRDAYCLISDTYPSVSFWTQSPADDDEILLVYQDHPKCEDRKVIHPSTFFTIMPVAMCSFSAATEHNVDVR